MPLITADFIFDGYTFLPENTVLQIADDGEIMHVFQTADFHGVKKYNGLLMPGMVNAHCHLELSHLKNRVEEKRGLVAFLLSILNLRENFSAAEKQVAIEKAEAEMINNGVVAVGDICNTLDTLLQKQKKNIRYHSFVECFGLRPDMASDIFLSAKKMQLAFEEYGSSSLVLHAPYSISGKLIKHIDEDSVGKITTIHNQECADENELFLHKTGSFLQLLDAIHFDKNDFKTEHKNSIRTYLPKFIHQQKIILVHNTFTNEEDIAFVNSSGKEIYWCLCPNANLYIENTLPDIEMMMRNHCNIVLGTDSLASNHTLSIWDEIKTIQKLKPEIPFGEILKWATSNGAAALVMDDTIGSIAPGKKPGIINIADFSGPDFSREEKNQIQRIC